MKKRQGKTGLAKLDINLDINPEIAVTTGGIPKRNRTKYIPFADGPDPDLVVVSMVKFQDKIYVATQKGVYILKDEQLERLKMVQKVKE